MVGTKKQDPVNSHKKKHIWTYREWRSMHRGLHRFLLGSRTMYYGFQCIFYGIPECGNK